jgi:hypothetical protein
MAHLWRIRSRLQAAADAWVPKISASPGELGPQEVSIWRRELDREHPPIVIPLLW